MSGAAKNLYELSDEELLELDPSTIPAASEAEPEVTEVPAANAESSATAEDEPAAVEEEEEDEGDPASAAAAVEEEEEEEEDPASPKKPDGEEPDAGAAKAEGDEAAADKDKDKDKDEKPDAPAAVEIDYKAAYEQLLAPFKANGKEIKVDNVEDAITLMQMGANYNKKMAALKPNLKLMKMLENHKLLDEKKLSFLIDLDRKDPAAIKKFIKESGVDPLEIDQEERSEYKPGTYTVDDREIALDEVLDKIQDTPTYQKTIDVVSNKWDGRSKQAVANDPNLLEVINAHMASGIYDLVSNEVEKERVLGRLNGLSDLEAYQQIGDAIHKRGGFAHLVPTQPAATPTAEREVKPKEATPDPVRSNKRRAASPTRTEIPDKKLPADFNPLAMSDEEFEKQTNSRLM